MSDKTALGARMKEFYEKRTRTVLTRRQPVIIRLDGKAFHTYTKGLDKPFDEGLIQDMAETTKFLCKNIQGCKAGYTQSDEISLLLTDFDRLGTDAWFDYQVQKMTSVAASMATAKFNQLRLVRSCETNITTVGDDPDRLIDAEGFMWNEEILDEPLAFFDARVFSIPEDEEVVNYFIWRQRDAEKNSVSMLAQSLFSHGTPNSELHKKNGTDMMEMCWAKGHNWNDLHYSKKRGSFIVKNTYVNDIRVKDKYEETCVGDIWYQPNNKDSMYPNKLGRLLVFAESAIDDDYDWCDIPIEKVRRKWEITETPIFSKQRKSLLNLLNRNYD